MTVLKSGNFLADNIVDVVRNETDRLLDAKMITPLRVLDINESLESYIISKSTKDQVVRGLSKLMDRFPELFDVLACIDLTEDN